MNEKKGQVKKDLYQIIDIIQEDNMKLKIMNKKSKIHENISQHLEQNVFLTNNFFLRNCFSNKKFLSYFRFSSETTMAPSSPARGQRRNSPFTKQQEAWVILQYGALSNCLAVRRKFRVHYKLSPFMVPRINAFRRLVSRFLESNGQVRPKAPAGRSPLTEELVQRVKPSFFLTTLQA